MMFVLLCLCCYVCVIAVCVLAVCVVCCLYACLCVWCLLFCNVCGLFVVVLCRLVSVVLLFILGGVFVCLSRYLCSIAFVMRCLCLCFPGDCLFNVYCVCLCLFFSSLLWFPGGGTFVLLVCVLFVVCCLRCCY